MANKDFYADVTFTKLQLKTYSIDELVRQGVVHDPNGGTVLHVGQYVKLSEDENTETWRFFGTSETVDG